jgi:ribonuclease-3
MKDSTHQDLIERLGYCFTAPELLTRALRHPSYAHENPHDGEHNQRLEFLGDAVVGLIVAESLVRNYPDAREGELTRWRAALVSEPPLAQTAKEIGLGDCLLLGKGEEAGGGRQRTSLLADAIEAVVGAAFLDGGLQAARAVVHKLLGERIDRISDEAPLDHKSKLQEHLQAKGPATPQYVVVGTQGPDHDKRFEVHLKLADDILGVGIGTSKKGAEQQAACQALARLQEQEQEQEQEEDDA